MTFLFPQEKHNLCALSIGLIFMFLPLDQITSRDTILVNEGHFERNINANEVQVFETSSADITFADIEEYAPLFKPYDDEAKSTIDYDNIVWLRFTIKNTGDKAIEYLFDIPRDMVDLWFISPSDTTHLQTGFLMPMSKKAVQLRGHFFANYVPLQLAANETIDVTIRIDHVSKRRIHVDHFKLVNPATTLDGLTKDRFAKNFRQGIYLSLFLVALMFFLVFYFFTKDLFTLYLSLYALTSFLFVLNLNDFIYWMLPDLPSLRLPLHYVLSITSHIIAYLTGIAFLRQKENLPRWYLFHGTMIGFLGVGIVTGLGQYMFSHNFEHLEMSILIGGVLIYVLGLLFGITLLRKRSRNYVLYGIASTVAALLGFLTIYAGWKDNLGLVRLLVETQLLSYTVIMLIGLTLYSVQNFIDLKELKVEHQRTKQVIRSIIPKSTDSIQYTQQLAFRRLPDAQKNQRIMTIIRDNLSNAQFSIDELAEELGISARHLRRHFNSHTDLNLNQTIKEERLLMAKYLLDEGIVTDARVIGEKVGYSNPEYFSRIFRERFGQTVVDHLESVK